MFAGLRASRRKFDVVILTVRETQLIWVDDLSHVSIERHKPKAGGPNMIRYAATTVNDTVRMGGRA